MEEDLEIQAMYKIKQTLAPLDEKAVERVLQWVAALHNISLGSQNSKSGRLGLNSDEQHDEAEFKDVASLFDAANPSTEPEKVLVVAYWLQVIEEHNDVDAQSINSELKNLGHGVGNITRALDNLINRKPRLVIQTRKSGTTQQARKRFKVTIEGIRKIKAMLEGKGNGDE